jgi:hypothetical protein
MAERMLTQVRHPERMYDGQLDAVEAHFIAHAGDDTQIAPSEMAFLEQQTFSNPNAKRQEQLRAHVGRIVLVLLWAAAALFGGLVLVAFYHLVTPPGVHWLSAQDLHGIHDMITHLATGAAGAFLGKYFKQAFGELDANQLRKA